MSRSQGAPPVIGLLGGIAAGKSTVAEMLGRLGASVVDADEIGHAVLNRPATRERITTRWGNSVVDDSGKVDRRKLAETVFGDAEELAALESIIHPAILGAMREEIQRARSSPEVMAVVVDAPLLLETELDGLCDVLVYVACPEDARRRRAAQRGWSKEQLHRRESRQQPLQAKRQLAHYTIDGNAPPETTFRQVEELWQEILGL
ncbi:MAG: dephospho-CoA kinase [Candidatus Brocadiia bacterium]